MNPIKFIQRWLGGNHKQLIIDALYPSNELAGLQISDATGIRLSRLYPALYALEAEGSIESRWGEQRVGNRGFARRRLYRLTRKGKRMRVDSFTKSFAAESAASA